MQRSAFVNDCLPVCINIDTFAFVNGALMVTSFTDKQIEIIASASNQPTATLFMQYLNSYGNAFVTQYILDNLITFDPILCDELSLTGTNV